MRSSYHLWKTWESKYDIAWMSKEDLLEVCGQIIHEGFFDEATMEVLC